MEKKTVGDMYQQDDHFKYVSRRAQAEQIRKIRGIPRKTITIIEKTQILETSTVSEFSPER